MAYLVKYGDTVLFEPGSDERVMHGAKLSQTADGVTRFDFTLPPGHPALSEISIRDMAHPVTVYFDGTELFYGFVKSRTTSLWLEESFSCVSYLALLDELLVRYKPTYRRGHYVLAELMAMWNNLTTHTYEFYEGKIEFGVDPQSAAVQVGYEDPSTGTIVVDAETTTPKSILSIIKDSMLDPYGAFIRMRRQDNGTLMVGVFPDAPDTSTQTVNLGENLLDYSYTETDEGMYNACLPVGGAIDHRELDRVYKAYTNVRVAEAASAGARYIKLKASSGTAYAHGGGSVMIGRYGYAVEGNGGELTTEPRQILISPPLTAGVSENASVTTNSTELYQYDDTCTLLNAGGAADEWSWDYNIAYNKTSVRAHGMKMFTFTDNDIRDAQTLFNKAKAMIIARLDFKRSLTVSALDMAFYLPSQKHLQAGQKLRVVSEPHGLDAVMYVRTADIDLDDPSQTKYVLGTVERTLSRQVRETAGNVRTGSDNFIKELNNRVTSTEIGRLWS